LNGQNGNGNGNLDNISLDNSEAHSLNHTMSGTMDEKQKMLLLKIDNNSMVTPTTAQACVHDSEYVNVSEKKIIFPVVFRCFFLVIFPLHYFSPHKFNGFYVN
jgi:hypothetical protein